ncbi:MAG TPA: GNAT family N-acetyltransferase [Streptosporangiaceae bacterium]|jgi:RimJ/RimL family protein N-acetyltransferase
MRVTFPRLPDHQRAYSLVERDDGVMYRLDGGVAGPRLPHDIVHLVVERELRIKDGIWAGIAKGVVFSSMTHVSGRCLRAELLADLVAAAAALDAPTPQRIRALAAAKLSVLPDAEIDPAAIAVAAQALQVEAARWARLRVGEHLDYEWPVYGQKARDTVTGRPPELIECGILTLRRWTLADVDALYRAVDESMDQLSPWMPWAPGYTRESAAGFIGTAATDWAEGTSYSYAMVAAGVIAGGTGLRSQADTGRMEIGYWVRQAYTRRGLASAATVALTEQAFLLPGINRVEIHHHPGNLASAGVPRKLGFTRAPEERTSRDGHLFTVWYRLADG